MNPPHPTLAGSSAPGAEADEELLRRVERFLRREARLLDEERYAEWLELLDDDLVYWAPVRANRYRRDADEDAMASGMAFFEDGKADLAMRIARIDSGKAWTEDPPTRHVYLVTNVEAFETGRAGEYDVRSAFLQYRNRGERDESTILGRREDVLRDTKQGLKLARRTILLAQSTLLAKNLSAFF